VRVICFASALQILEIIEARLVAGVLLDPDRGRRLVIDLGTRRMSAADLCDPAQGITTQHERPDPMSPERRVVQAPDPTPAQLSQAIAVRLLTDVLL